MSSRDLVVKILTFTQPAWVRESRCYPYVIDGIMKGIGPKSFP